MLEAASLVKAKLTDEDHNAVADGTDSALAEGTVTAGTTYAIVEAYDNETSTPDTKTTGGSGGGCNAGFAGIAALAALALIKKSK